MKYPLWWFPLSFLLSLSLSTLAAAHPIQSRIHKGTTDAFVDFFSGMNQMNPLRRYSEMAKKGFHWIVGGLGDESGDDDGEERNPVNGQAQEEKKPKPLEDTREQNYGNKAGRGRSSEVLSARVRPGGTTKIDKQQFIDLLMSRDRVRTHLQGRKLPERQEKRFVVGEECTRRGLTFEQCQKIVYPGDNQKDHEKTLTATGLSGALMGLWAGAMGLAVSHVPPVDQEMEEPGRVVQEWLYPPDSHPEPRPDVIETSFNELAVPVGQPAPEFPSVPNVSEVPEVTSGRLFVEMVEPVLFAAAL